MLPLILKTAAVVFALFIALRWFERAQVYHPTREWLADPPVPSRPPEDVALVTKDGVKLHAWHFKADPSSPRSGIVWLVLHGNGGNLSLRGPMFQTLLSLGVNVLALDYRGYGRSEGSPDEEGTYRDAEAAMDWLKSRGYPPEKIVVHGESLGGGVASYVAASQEIGGLVIQSSFTSVPDIGSEKFPFLPVRLVAAFRYPTRERLPFVKVPVLILHSRRDQIIPFHHGEKNFAAARDPKLFWELHAGHNDYLLSDAPNFFTGLDTYLTRYFPCPPTSP